MSNKRCGTCVSRKIRCDRGFPTCSQCVLTGRECPGYGLRLSWPRQNDRKRQLLGPDSSQELKRGRGHRHEAVHFIPATNWDIGLYRYLQTSNQAEKFGLAQTLCQSLSWVPPKLTAGEKHLLEYFDARVSKNLMTLNERPLGGLLVRIALSSNSVACVAVQRAMLALSSLLRYGDSIQTQRLKLSAVQALGTSAKHGVSRENAAQHVSAGLLLCMLEIYSHSVTSYQWMWYVTGARDVVATISIDWFDQQTDFSDLSDWLYYHEVLSQFTLRHWKPEPLSNEQVFRPDLMVTPRLPQRTWETDLRLAPCTMMQKRNNALRTLSEVIETVLPPSDPQSQDANYRARIRHIRDFLEPFVSTDDKGGDPSATMSESDPKSPAEVMSLLYRLSTLIYLARASGNHAGVSAKLAQYVRAGLRLLNSMSECTRPFPILIIGSEAKTDEERKLVLDLIHRTEEFYPDRRMVCMRDKLLLAMWNQDDLHAAERTQPGYWERLTAVVSLCGMLPSFA